MDLVVDGIFVVVNGSVNVDPVVASVDEDSPVDGIFVVVNVSVDIYPVVVSVDVD